MKRFFTFLVLMILFVFSTKSFSQCNIGGIFIDAALLDPNGSNNFDTDGDGTAETEDEFVQICNSSASSIDLSSYTLGDDEGVITLSGSLAAGECLVVMRQYTGTPPVGQNFLIDGSFAQLANGGEPLFLSDGTTTCTIAFGVTCDGSMPNCTQWPEDTDGVVTVNGTADPLVTPADLGQTTLPIKLQSFTATKKSTTTLLQWQTATEINNDYMAIERSNDGRTFNEIGRVQGTGTSYEANDYSFVDEKPNTGMNYYRLRQVDYDGRAEIHRTVSVFFGDANDTVQIFPTEADNEINVIFAKITTDKTQLIVVDVTGKECLRTELGLGQSEYTLDVSSLTAGHFFLRIQNEMGIEVARFMKL